MERYQRVEHVILITFVWALVLYGVHFFFDKPVQSAALPPKGGLVTARITHLCCSGCYDSALRAVGMLPWLTDPVLKRLDLPTQDQAEQGVTSIGTVAGHRHQQGYSGRIAVRLDPTQAQTVDFVALDQTLRKEGLVAGQVTLTGLQHFELVAHLPHMCCQLCGTAVQEAFAAIGVGAAGAPGKTPGYGPPAKVEVDQAQQLVTAEFRTQADVSLFMRTLDQAGFAPDKMTLKVLPG